MIVKTMDDLRAALERMATHNQVSMTGLNELAKIGQGILARLRRGQARTRSYPDSPVRLIEADIKFTTLLRVIEAAGWEMELRPKSQPNRRTRVLNAVRDENQKGVAGDQAEAVLDQAG